MALGAEHVRHVRVLYKSILKLHRGMPLELRALGDLYVKEEFQRHKDCDLQFVPTFMNEWTIYAITLATQLGKKTDRQTVGKSLTLAELDGLREEQIGQLYELFTEASKPLDPENPLGYNPRVDKS